MATLRQRCIADNIRKLIEKECDGNQAEFDRIIGKNTADRLINMRSTPRKTTLELIAQRFNTTTDWLESDNREKGGDAKVTDDYNELYRKYMECRIELAETKAELRVLKEIGQAPNMGRSLLKNGTN